MALTSRIVDSPVRPLELAGSLADRPGFCFLWSASGGTSYLAADPIEMRSSFDPEPELPLESGSALARAPRWIGVLPYESCRGCERPGRGREWEDRPLPPLAAPCWLRFGAVAVLGDRVQVVGDDRGAVEELAARLRRHAPVPAGALGAGPTPEPASRHAERIRVALEWIAAGDLYQVNLARAFDFKLQGHPLGVLLELVRRSRANYSVCLRMPEADVISTSPELFLRLDPDRRLWTQPIKGTRPRGQDRRSDAALVETLELDEKERAELAMVIDVERNDLGRIAVPGSVRMLGPPRVVTHPTVHHRLADVVGRVRGGLSRGQILAAMLPSGSITGAPKVRAMELIARLEARRRGLYTGAFGLLRHDGGLELAMAIRTLVDAGGLASYFSGGGIVADSDPRREVVETYWKARQLAGLAGLPESWFTAG